MILDLAVGAVVAVGFLETSLLREVFQLFKLVYLYLLAGEEFVETPPQPPHLPQVLERPTEPDIEAGDINPANLAGPRRGVGGEISSRAGSPMADAVAGDGRHGAHGHTGTDGAPSATGAAANPATGRHGRPHGTNGDRFLAVFGLSGTIRSHKTPKNALRALDLAAAVTGLSGHCGSHTEIRESHVGDYVYCISCAPHLTESPMDIPKAGTEPNLFCRLLKGQPS